MVKGSRILRIGILVFLDILLINLAMIMAILLRFEGELSQYYRQFMFQSAPMITIGFIGIFYIFGLYRSLWRYASDKELFKVIMAVFISSIFMLTFKMILNIQFSYAVFILASFLAMLMVGGSRITYRYMRRYLSRPGKYKSGDHAVRVLVIGGGDAGAMIIREMFRSNNRKYSPVAILDEEQGKWYTRIKGVPVKGGLDRLQEVCEKEQIDEIIIAMPSVAKKRIADIAKSCRETGCKIKILPGLYDIIDDKISFKNIRNVSIEDLLGREETKLNTAAIAGYLKNEVILVTGGGGSIGSELCRQIAKFSPKLLLILDNYENSAYDLQNELKSKFPKLKNEVIIASIREIERLRQIFEKYKPGVVFHAAAHKHVALMEHNPDEAIKNNVVGTLNTAKCADEFKVKRFVLISTDKAVNPTNIMGATKRLAELTIQAMDKISSTEFVAVRFGNVLGSNGSVVPLFKKQIESGGPITITHPEVTRYFMTIPEASRLVIQAGAMAKGGEIFVLDMGESVKIVDLARELIRLSGLIPDEDIKIEYIGLKPGEKLYEELLMKEEGLISTNQDGIFVAPPSNVSYKEVKMWIEKLKNCLENHDSDIKTVMADTVTTYSYNPDDDKVAVGEG